MSDRESRNKDARESAINKKLGLHQCSCVLCDCRHIVMGDHERCIHCEVNCKEPDTEIDEPCLVTYLRYP